MLHGFAIVRIFFEEAKRTLLYTHVLKGWSQQVKDEPELRGTAAVCAGRPPRMERLLARFGLSDTIVCTSARGL